MEEITTNICALILGIFFLLVILFLCFVFTYLELKLEKKKQDYINMLDEKERLIVSDYLNYAKLSLRDFKKRRKEDRK